ncbi:MAG TPA: hypothetical protein VFD23_04755 [Clostridia bacterium]|nr:hypothetical protein [Clostridia bacterium]
MTKNFNFTTAGGNNIDFTAEITHTTQKEVDADGYKVMVDCSEYDYKITGLKINGEDKKVVSFNEGMGHICFGYQGASEIVYKDDLLIAIPQKIMGDMKREENAENSARTARAEKVESEYQANYNRTMRAMNI